MDDLEVMSLLAVTTKNLRYEDFRGPTSFLCTMHGGSHPKQVKMGSRMGNNSFVV